MEPTDFYQSLKTDQEDDKELVDAAEHFVRLKKQVGLYGQDQDFEKEAGLAATALNQAMKHRALVGAAGGAVVGGLAAGEGHRFEGAAGGAAVGAGAGALSAHAGPWAVKPGAAPAVGATRAAQKALPAAPHTAPHVPPSGAAAHAAPPTPEGAANIRMPDGSIHPDHVYHPETQSLLDRQGNVIQQHSPAAASAPPVAPATAGTPGLTSVPGDAPTPVRQPGGVRNSMSTTLQRMNRNDAEGIAGFREHMPYSGLASRQTDQFDPFSGAILSHGQPEGEATAGVAHVMSPQEVAQDSNNRLRRGGSTKGTVVDPFSGQVYDNAQISKVAMLRAMREKTAAIFGEQYPDEVRHAAIPYSHRKKSLLSYSKKKAKEQPTGYGKSMAVGGGVGAGAGALIGSSLGRKGALTGALLGGAMGAGSGAIAAMADHLHIDEAKQLLKSKNVDPAIAKHISRRIQQHEQYERSMHHLDHEFTIPWHEKYAGIPEAQKGDASPRTYDAGGAPVVGWDGRKGYNFTSVHHEGKHHHLVDHHSSGRVGHIITNPETGVVEHSEIHPSHKHMASNFHEHAQVMHHHLSHALSQGQEKSAGVQRVSRQLASQALHGIGSSEPGTVAKAKHLAQSRYGKSIKPSRDPLTGTAEPSSVRDLLHKAEQGKGKLANMMGGNSLTKALPTIKPVGATPASPPTPGSGSPTGMAGGIGGMGKMGGVLNTMKPLLEKINPMTSPKALGVTVGALLAGGLTYAGSRPQKSLGGRSKSEAETEEMVRGQQAMGEKNTGLVKKLKNRLSEFNHGVAQAFREHPIKASLLQAATVGAPLGYTAAKLLGAKK